MEKKVLTLFVSQPMHNRNESEVIMERSMVKMLVEALNPEYDVYLIDQYSAPDPPDIKDWPEVEQRIYRLSRSIGMMYGKNLLVVFAGGNIVDSKGCMVELAVCQQYGLNWTTMHKLFSELKEKNSEKFKSFLGEASPLMNSLYGMSQSPKSNEEDTRHFQSARVDGKFKSFKELMEEEHQAVEDLRWRKMELIRKAQDNPSEIIHVNHELNNLIDKINYARECLNHALEPIEKLEEED